MKASVYIATTLDGFIARENGDLDWLPGSDGTVDADLENEDFDYNTFMDSTDTLVMGRNTYEMITSFGHWPYENKRVIVLSSSLTEVENSAELKSCPPEDLYNELERSGAKHVYIDGGKTIQGFLRAGLIDEITITKIPVLIGTGISLFGPLEKDCHLNHIETKSYKNGFVQSKYNALRQHVL
ncbi:MAG: dihydrofolate reductase family protein [Gammaproteobacteria bacterium]|nr:dihydrofolate reductase family protein [Gammaproteobacteria bacterium]